MWRWSLYIVVAVLTFFAFSTSGFSAYTFGDDIEPGNLPEGFAWDNDECARNTWTYYLDADNKLQKKSVRTVAATQALKDEHVKTSTGQKLAHNHKQLQFDDPGYITKQEANRYWNKRFDAGANGRCRLVSDADDSNNCMSWAFDGYVKVMDGAARKNVYKYWVPSGQWATAFADDTNNVDLGTININDLLRYGPNHVSVITDKKAVPQGGGLPDKQVPINLIWKFNVSGVYTYNTYSPGAGHEYNTPLCEGGNMTPPGAGLPDLGIGQILNCVWNDDGGGKMVNQAGYGAYRSK